VKATWRPHFTTRPIPFSFPGMPGRKKLVFISRVGATAVMPEATMQATLIASSSMAQR
jgi:hypothetical protein